MSDGSKQVIVKKAQGEYEFTPYGEFLSYFHAHIDIFKKLLKSKKVEPDMVEAIAKQIKTFMTGNIKKTEQFFENLPNFSAMLGVPQAEVSAYLNTNFIDVLTKVQEKLKNQEIEKINNAPEQTYRFIAEEIVEKLQVTHPADFVFAPKGILLVLENPKTGEIIEPQGLMAESAKAALSIPANASEGDGKPPISLTEAITKANAPPTPVVKKSLIPEKEKSILQEIVESFSDTLTGEKLEVHIGPEGSENIHEEVKPQQTKKDDYEIEDLEFDDSESDQSSSNELSEDFSQDIDVDFDDGESAPEVDPHRERLLSYSIKEYMELLQQITNFQTKSDQVGYQNWLRDQPDFEKSVVSIRTQLIKEQKGEPVNWSLVYSSITSKADISESVLGDLQKKLKNYQIVKMTLDRTIQELKKGSPEFIQLVRMAWPHIQKAFFEVPNYSLVQTQLKGILSKVTNEDHRKEFTRIFTMALNFIQTKFIL